MREHKIAYGFTNLHVENPKLKSISRQVRSMMTQHPEIHHEEVNVSWLLDNPADWDSYATAGRIKEQQTTLGQIGDGD